MMKSFVERFKHTQTARRLNRRAEFSPERNKRRAKALARLREELASGYKGTGNILNYKRVKLTEEDQQRLRMEIKTLESKIR